MAQSKHPYRSFSLGIRGDRCNPLFTPTAAIGDPRPSLQSAIRADRCNRYRRAANPPLADWWWLRVSGKNPYPTGIGPGAKKSVISGVVNADVATSGGRRTPPKWMLH